MNPLHMIILAEYHRQDLESEMRQIRLEQTAASARPYRPNWFARSMYNFANWMIGTGKQIRRRYEIPVKGCASNPTGSFAR
jgi:hypothetical protein